MAQWMIWSIFAAALVILELFSGTFYLLMIAIGLAAGAIVAWAGGALEIQWIVAAVVGLLATSILRRCNIGCLAKRHTSGNPDMSLDIGQAIMVDQWSTQALGNGPITSPLSAPPTARVMYRGAMWDVELADNVGAQGSQWPLPGRFLIQAIEGSRLMVGRPQ